MDDEPALYQQIAESLRRDVAAGKFAGEKDKLPGEKALAELWSTSTATSSKALKLLEREGVIEIRRGVGAYARRRKPIIRDANGRLAREQWGAGKAIWQFDLGDHYPVPSTDVFRDDDEKAPEVPDFVRAALPAERYVIRDRKFTVDGWLIQLATSYFDASIVAGSEIERRDSGPGGAYARLAELGHEPVAFREQVRIRLPLDDEAKRLKITTDKPIAEIVRQAKTAEGKIVEVNVMLLLGDAYVLQYAFTA